MVQHPRRSPVGGPRRGRLALSTLAGLLTLTGLAFAVGPGDGGPVTFRDQAERDNSPRAVAPSGPAPPAGSLLSFGLNSFGQLGVGANSGTAAANSTPMVVTLPGQNGSVTQVAVGGSHSLAVTSSGQLYSFGYNRFGQLGRAANKHTPTPTPTAAPVPLPGQSGTVTEVAAGRSHSLALTSTGQLYSFGENLRGQLGRALHSGSRTPTPTPALVTLPGQSGTVTQIAAGQYHSLAATSGGQLYAFGYNKHGELGRSSGVGTRNAHSVPALVSLPAQNGSITQLAAGLFHSLAITSSGQLYAWGRNKHGELGSAVSGGPPYYANPTPTPVALPSVSAIAGGSFHSLAATSGGVLYAFGYDAYGQLGDTVPAPTDTNPAPVPVTLPGRDGAITRLGAGASDSLVVSSSGQLYTFGYNAQGQLGIDANTNTHNPNPTPTVVPLPPGTGIETVATGSPAHHTLAVVSASASGGSGPPGPSGEAGSPVVTMAPPGETPPPQTRSRVSVVRIGISHRHPRLVAGRYERVRLRCPAAATAICSGHVKLSSRFGTSRVGYYRLAPGASHTYRLRLGARLLAYIVDHHITRLAVRVVVVNKGPDDVTGAQRHIHVTR
jgi:alpha-tubulin suppressor-like RCC1 family protein